MVEPFPWRRMRLYRRFKSIEQFDQSFIESALTDDTIHDCRNACPRKTVTTIVDRQPVTGDSDGIGSRGRESLYHEGSGTHFLVNAQPGHNRQEFIAAFNPGVAVEEQFHGFTDPVSWRHCNPKKVRSRDGAFRGALVEVNWGLPKPSFRQEIKSLNILNQEWASLRPTRFVKALMERPVEVNLESGSFTVISNRDWSASRTPL